MKRMLVPMCLCAVLVSAIASADLRYINQGGVPLIQLTDPEYTAWKTGSLTGPAACTAPEDLADATGVCPQVRCVDDTRIVADVPAERRAVLGAGPLQALGLESGSYRGQDWGDIVLNGLAGSYTQVSKEGIGPGWFTMTPAGTGAFTGTWGDATGRNGSMTVRILGCRQADVSWEALTPPLTSGRSTWN